MNKKFMAMLLVIVMVVSMVPMTALAVDEGHVHDYLDHTVPNGDGTHKFVCSCNEEDPNGAFTMDCRDYSGDSLCDSCGYDLYQNHICDFSKLTKSTDGVTHNLACSCGKSVDINCNDGDGDGNCDGCGYKKYTPDPDANKKHENEEDHTWTYADNGNGTHSGSCVCGETLNPVPHDHTNGGTCVCGNMQCTHVFQGWVNKGETHDVMCRDCSLPLQTDAAHVFEDTYCACGAHEHNYEASRNDDKTHDLVCVCGGKVENIPCNDGNTNDGKCDTCGNVLYEIPNDKPHGENDHEWTYSYNNDGTHSGSCKCGATKAAATCADADADGKCDACGHLMPVAPVEPTPDQAAAAAVGLDYVPKTGCAFIEWLYALIFG